MTLGRLVGLLTGISLVHYSNTITPYSKQFIYSHSQTKQTSKNQASIKSISPFKLKSVTRYHLKYSHTINNINQTIKICIRFIQLAFLFSPALLSLPIFIYRTNFLRDNMSTERWWPLLLANTIQYAGPTFIKVCESSSKNDINS